jgi:phospholipase/carboxylesterase
MQHIEFFSLPCNIRLSNLEKPQILLFLLHGSFSDELSMLKWTEFVDPRITIVMPRALFPVEETSKKMMWFKASFIDSQPVIDSTQAEISRVTLIAFIKEVQRHLGMDVANTFIAGFSQGGVLSASVALTSPQLVRGFSILSGRILPDVVPLIAPIDNLAHLSALVCHGTSDELLSVNWAEKSQEILLSLRITTRVILGQYKHELNQNTLLNFNQWLIHHILKRSTC